MKFLCVTVLALGWQCSPAMAGLGDMSGDLAGDMSAENAAAAAFAERIESINNKVDVWRTGKIVKSVSEYLVKNNVLVAFLSRRGKETGDPKEGVSDVDAYDATGMAHTGIVIRTQFGGKDKASDQYITMNLVRIHNRDSSEDRSQLRAWRLEQFFGGTFEKDAMISLPSMALQTRLWNALMNGFQITPMTEQTANGPVQRSVITGGVFTKFHNERYSLLSDYANDKTQNCNEHLVKTVLAIKNGLSDLGDMQTYLERNFGPYEMKLGFFKEWAANSFLGMNIPFDERQINGTNRVLMMTAESLIAPENRSVMGIEKLQVFRERPTLTDFLIDDHGDDYVKANVVTGKRNQIHRFSPYYR